MLAHRSRKYALAWGVLVWGVLLGAQGCVQDSEENGGYGAITLEQFCDSDLGNDPKKWLSAVDAVVVGKVLEIKPMWDQKALPSNRCWVHVETEKSLKGNVPSSIWVNVFYNAHNKNAADMRNPHTCPMQPNNQYIIFAYKHSGTEEFNRPFLVTLGSKNKYGYCTPVMPLESSSEVLEMLSSDTE